MIVDDALLWQAQHVISNCRARDRVEIEAAVGFANVQCQLPEWLASAVTAQVFLDRKGIPAVLVAAHAFSPRCLSLSLVATDAWRQIVRTLIAWAQRDFKPRLLELGYRRAECRAIDGHEDAQRLLEWLGFELECRCPEFGAGGETFLQYAWRSKQHVLRTED